MEILKEYDQEKQNRKDMSVNTDDYLLNQKLNELSNRERKKIEDDNKKYEKMEQAKPFQCSICGENFSLDVNLKEHMLKHTKIKTEEEMDEEKEKEKENKDNNNDVNNVVNKDLNKEKKEEEKIEEKKEEENNGNENGGETKDVSTNNNGGLGFFGRLMAPIFLTETEINHIKGNK